MFKADSCHAAELVRFLIHLQFHMQHVTGDPKYLVQLLGRDFVIKLQHKRQLCKICYRQSIIYY